MGSRSRNLVMEGATILFVSIPERIPEAAGGCKKV
jgi:hypothetical protein